MQLLYAGGTESWCEAHGVDVATLPSFIYDFKEEQAGLRLRDSGRELEKHALARGLEEARSILAQVGG